MAKDDICEHKYPKWQHCPYCVEEQAKRLAGTYQLGAETLKTIRDLIEFADCSELHSKEFEQRVRQLKRDLFQEEEEVEVHCKYHGSNKSKCGCP